MVNPFSLCLFSIVSCLIFNNFLCDEGCYNVWSRIFLFNRFKFKSDMCNPYFVNLFRLKSGDKLRRICCVHIIYVYIRKCKFLLHVIHYSKNPMLKVYKTIKKYCIKQNGGDKFNSELVHI